VDDTESFFIVVKKIRNDSFLPVVPVASMLRSSQADKTAGIRKITVGFTGCKGAILKTLPSSLYSSVHPGFEGGQGDATVPI
jgi:hypothetical protein